MSEVKRYRFKGAAGEYVYDGDFDNAAQCFLTAAEGCVAAERRETAALKELGRYKEAYRGAVKGRSAFRDSVRRLRAERDALQLRLNAADQLADDIQEERQKLIAYGRSCGLDEASTTCSRMAYDTYYPAGSRFKYFVPRAQARLGDLLIKAANAIASLPDGPYNRFKASQQKKAEKSAAA